MSFIPIDEFRTPRDFAGRRGSNSMYGETVVGIREDDISVQFQYSNSTLDVTPTISGGGTTSNSNHQAVVSLDSAVGSASLVSVDPVRYRAGHEVRVQFTSVYEGAQSGVTQNHGIYNGIDGAGFGTENGVFGVWLLNNGVRDFIPQSSWLNTVYTDRLDGSGTSKFNLDITKMNIYQVAYSWHGIAPIVFSVYTGLITGWVVCHVVDKVNTIAVPHMSNPTLPIKMEVVRASGTGTEAHMRSSSWKGGIIGGIIEPPSSDRWFSHTELGFTVTAGVNNNIFTIRSKSTYQGLTNHVVSELAVVAFDNSTNKTYAIYGNKGATLAGNSAYSDINTANSVMEVSTGGTVTGGARGPATIVRKDTDRRTDVRDTGIFIYPGQTFTFEIVPESGAVGTASVSARWIERF